MAVDIGPALGLTADSSSLVKATDELQDLSAAAKQAQISAQGLVGSTDKVAAAAGRVGVAAGSAADATKRLAPAMSNVTQQSRLVALQLSQVAQQTMAGGGFIRALAIQLPDMAVGFGAVGIAAGVLAGVALPLLASALGGAGDAAENLKERMETLQSATEAYRSALEALQVPAQEMIENYGSMSVAAREFAEAMAQIEGTNATLAASEAIRALTTDLLGLAMASEDGTVEWRFLAEELGVSEQAAVSLSVAMSLLESAEGPREQAEAARRLAATLETAAGGYSNMNARAREVYQAAVQIGSEMADVTAETNRAREAAQLLASSGPEAGWLSGAISDASVLAGTLWNAAEAAAAARDATLSETYAGFGDDERGGQRLQGRSAGEFRRRSAITDRNRAGGGGGGGGGGGADERGTQLEALIESLRTERETVELWRTEQLELLAQYSETELSAIGGANEAKLRLEAEYQERLRGIRDTANGGALQDASSFFGGMADLAKAGGEKTLKITQALAATQGVINSYLAFTEVLKDPAFIGRPWARAGAAAAALAQGLGAVASIRGASSGGGGGGARGASAAPAAASQASPVSVSIAGLNPNDLYSGSSVIGLVDAVQKELKNRGAIISFV